MFKQPVRWMIAAALVVGTLSACDEGPGPTGVDVIPTNESADLTGPSSGSVYEATLSLEEASFYKETTDATLLTADRWHGSDFASRIVGPSGGTISVDGHTLEIPPNAVLQDTEFTMVVPSGTNVLVDLSARSVGSGEPVSVFPVPLTLTLSYRNAARNSKAGRLRNVYLHQDSPDLMIPLPSTVSKRNKTVSSPIEHFSLYGMAIN